MGLPRMLNPPWKVDLSRRCNRTLDASCNSLQMQLAYRCCLQSPWLLQVILLSDGSVTRHLQLMTNLDVKVVSCNYQDS